MKLSTKVLIQFLTYSCLMTEAFAYKFVVFTDQENPEVAQNVISEMKKTYPFNKFEIDYEIVTLPPSDLNCGSSRGIDRLVTCDDLPSIQKRAQRYGGDQAMIVKQLDKWGGSSAIGSGVPVITTKTSPRAMIHEYLHTLGLCDEYKYAQQEADLYCGKSPKRPNLVYIEPKDSYGSDDVARLLHGGQIPWFGQILATTPITNTNGLALGTGEVDKTKIAPPNASNMPTMLDSPMGLYKGDRCDNATEKVYSWHPGGNSTIMNNINAGLGAPLEKIVEDLLVSKGVRPKMGTMEIEEAKAPVRRVRSLEVLPRESNEEVKPSRSVAAPKEQEYINDSPRGSFKEAAERFLGTVRRAFGR